jgi:hypothetical protein
VIAEYLPRSDTKIVQRGSGVKIRFANFALTLKWHKKKTVELDGLKLIAKG